ncbi:MAG: class I SAM-dependent methyltransferase [Saprospiraceae bacterium]|nr:class I SAM-dependent methyltransferase [Saprospiraceae bacterium]
MKPSKDNFSQQADFYARFRPGYPDALFDWVFQQITSFERAWDCGTGNGQIALKLADRFEVVLATDISEAQLDKATPRENIMYRVSRAEQTDMPMEFFDLITIGQALHWFDFDAFFAEAKRVIKPGGWLAAWGYELCTLPEKLNPVIHSFYHDVLGDYWDPERRHVDNAYADIPFPFLVIPTPKFVQTMHWDLEEMEGFLNTWSAVQHYRKATGEDPVKHVMKDLNKLWPSGEKQVVSFPLFLKMGKLQR